MPSAKEVEATQLQAERDFIGGRLIEPGKEELGFCIEVLKRTKPDFFPDNYLAVAYTCPTRLLPETVDLIKGSALGGLLSTQLEFFKKLGVQKPTDVHVGIIKHIARMSYRFRVVMGDAGSIHIGAMVGTTKTGKVDGFDVHEKPLTFSYSFIPGVSPDGSGSNFSDGVPVTADMAEEIGNIFDMVKKKATRQFSEHALLGHR